MIQSHHPILKVAFGGPATYLGIDEKFNINHKEILMKNHV